MAYLQATVMGSLSAIVSSSVVQVETGKPETHQAASPAMAAMVPGAVWDVKTPPVPAIPAGDLKAVVGGHQAAVVRVVLVARPAIVVQAEAAAVVV